MTWPQTAGPFAVAAMCWTFVVTMRSKCSHAWKSYTPSTWSTETSSPPTSCAMELETCCSLILARSIDHRVRLCTHDGTPAGDCSRRSILRRPSLSVRREGRVGHLVDWRHYFSYPFRRAAILAVEVDGGGQGGLPRGYVSGEKQGSRLDI